MQDLCTQFCCVFPLLPLGGWIKKNVFPSSCFSTFENNNNHCLWKRSLFWSSGFPTSGDGAFYRKRQQLVLQKMAQSTSTQSSALPASGCLFPSHGAEMRAAPSGHSYLPWTLLLRVDRRVIHSKVLCFVFFFFLMKPIVKRSASDVATSQGRSWITQVLSSVQSLSRVQLFATPWTTARQASLSITNSWSLPKRMSVESVMPSIISSSVAPFSSCPQSFPASGSFQMSQFFASGGQNVGFSFSISPSNEYSGLISFRMDGLISF